MMNKDHLVWGLEELSDREMQESLWLGKVPGQMSSFDEAVCGVFDDSGLGDILDVPSRNQELSDDILEKARALSKAVHRIKGSVTTLSAIRDVKMEEVRRIASELLDMVRP